MSTNLGKTSLKLKAGNANPMREFDRGVPGRFDVHLTRLWRATVMFMSRSMN